jgi:uncharacterized protein (DUF2235 family)
MSIGQPTAAVAAPRTLVLFSDGTGNSSAKLFKTNVWRMYEAVDLGPDSAAGPLQIAYYDNGIGTQAFRFLAILAGIFGFGLKANVLRLYRFACRNGQPGCRIHCFGFSRGAFTIRLVAALIANEGLVDYDSEGELHARSLDAFRRFSRGNNPNVFRFLGSPARWLRDRTVRIKRAMFGPRINPDSVRRKADPQIAFIGVWDTVAAYGGPIAELTRGIDDYLYPLTMTDFCLDGKVGCARHALALDDERDAFHPVLWDELDWKRKADAAHDPADPDKASANAAFRDRLKQVWFTGMHSDVGGGYPDESLSYVSLCWMMAEAKAEGLRLLPDAEKRVREMANSLGPIHDSRGGFGAYYRPQPRKIAAFMHAQQGDELHDMTLSLRDPVIGDLQEPPHGLLLECRVHESVVARLAQGTDDYAPLTLPPTIAVEPFSPGIGQRGGNPVVDPDLVGRLQQPARDWWFAQERIWNKVWWRRICYFLTVILTAAFVLLPAWVDNVPEPDATDNRWRMERMAGWNRFVTPELLRPWVRAFEINPWLFWGLILAALVLTGVGGMLKRMAASESRVLWDGRLRDRAMPPAALGSFARFRTGRAYQRTLQVLKWLVAPPLAALLLSLALLWLALIAATQATWSWSEKGLCTRSASPPMAGPIERLAFATWELCHEPKLSVARDRRYEITFIERQSWFDSTTEADPIGLDANALGAVGLIGAPLRRIVDAEYLQPLYEIRPAQKTAGRIPKVVLRTLKLVREDGLEAVESGGRLEIRPRNAASPGKAVFRAVIVAPESGELFLFSNDAAVFGWRRFFYGNNCGTALVTIRALDAAEEPPDGTFSVGSLPEDLPAPRRCKWTEKASPPK